MNAKQSILFFSLIFFTVLSYGQSLVQVWDTGPKLKTPESVLYDHENGVIYVSNINDSPGEKDGNGFISILNTDGTIKNLEWISGLSAPKGMAIFKGKLYVSDIDELVEIEIANSKIVKKYPVEGATFLNDVAACGNGMIFVSDSNTGKIHVLNEGEISLWMYDEQMGHVNGLMTKMGELYIGSDKIFKTDIKGKKAEIIQTDCQGIDGLEQDNKGNFVFSNWPGRIFYLKDGKMIKLLDSTAEKINTADIDFAKELDLLLVPTFFKNSVVAYKIEM
ncbi:hypothetical protein ACUNWD_09080 [Sunxiuqinia sp. A32]|uniref:hypothetical protein n=1 Tax=Sunxiuqinia sp. A32 TaxID=3461496 RepID=UPI004045A7C8